MALGVVLWETEIVPYCELDILLIKKLDSDLEEERLSTKYYYRTVYRIKECYRLIVHIFPSDTSIIQG